MFSRCRQHVADNKESLWKPTKGWTTTLLLKLAPEWNLQWNKSTRKYNECFKSLVTSCSHWCWNHVPLIYRWLDEKKHTLLGSPVENEFWTHHRCSAWWGGSVPIQTERPGILLPRTARGSFTAHNCLMLFKEFQGAPTDQVFLHQPWVTARS